MRVWGSAKIISPSMAKEAVTPPVVGSVNTVRYNKPALEWRLTAADILAICIRLIIPSCMRAPPEAVKMTTGNFSVVAYSNKRVIFSPTTMPIDAMMKLESMMARAVF